jgi:hypothetical protein
MLALSAMKWGEANVPVSAHESRSGKDLHRLQRKEGDDCINEEMERTANPCRKGEPAD